MSYPLRLPVMRSALPPREEPGTGALRPTIQALAEQVRQIEGTHRTPSTAVISSGSPALDRLLPAGGFRRGWLVEWLAKGPGSGAATLALRAAVQAARGGGALVVVERGQRFYPPAVAQLGLNLDQLILVRPVSQADQAWALDQALRCAGVAAVWSAIEAEDDHTLRRWQLAAESSGVLGMLSRPQRARHEPSWAELRLLVEPLPITHLAAGALPEQPPLAGRSRRLRVELFRSRSGSAGRVVEVDVPVTSGGPLATPGSNAPKRIAVGSTQHETRALHLAPPLASAKTGRRSRRA